MHERLTFTTFFNWAENKEKKRGLSAARLFGSARRANNGNNLYLSDMQDKRGGGTPYQWARPPPFMHATAAARQTMQPLGALQHLSSGIGVVTNLVSITQSANLMTSRAPEEEWQWRKALTLNHLAHTGSILKQLEVSPASMISSRSWRANCTSKGHKY